MRTTQNFRARSMGVLVAASFPVHVAHADDGRRVAERPLGAAGASATNDASASRNTPVSIEFARQLFEDAMKYREAGDLELACDRFLESYRIYPRKASAFQLAACWEQQGRTVAAQRIFLEVAKLARRDGDKSAADEATKRAHDLDTRHSTLVINVAPAAVRIAGLSIRMDETLVLPTDWNRTRLPVDAGDRVITASAPGYQRFTTAVHIEKDASVRHVDIPGLNPYKDPSAEKKTFFSTSSNPTTKEWGLMLGGGTLAFLAAGALLVQITALDDWRRDDKHKFQTIGIATWIGASLTCFWGVDLYRSRRSAFRQALLVPQMTPTSLGFSLNAQF